MSSFQSPLQRSQNLSYQRPAWPVPRSKLACDSRLLSGRATSRLLCIGARQIGLAELLVPHEPGENLRLGPHVISFTMAHDGLEQVDRRAHHGHVDAARATQPTF